MSNEVQNCMMRGNCLLVIYIPIRTTCNTDHAWGEFIADYINFTHCFYI